MDLTVDLVLSDNIKEKFHKLGIEADLQVSILSGLVEPTGAASFLTEERKSDRAARMSLIYKVIYWWACKLCQCPDPGNDCTGGDLPRAETVQGED